MEGIYILSSEMVPSDVVVTDVLIYAGISYIIFALFNIYARQRLGKDSEAYKVLSIPKFIMLIAISIISIALIIAILAGVKMNTELETFIGIPYFAFWFYYMVSVLHRVVSEKKRNNLADKNNKGSKR